jgi:drug/metabolite transporter (DMT)-like permease
VLVATLLALAAAVLHAAWNLAVKQSGDRYTALWGQFFVAGLIGLSVILATSALSALGAHWPSGAPITGFPASGWRWAAMSGAVHLPYCWFLAKAYDHGDFSLVYPMARGAGALLAAIGGLVLLGDHISPLGCVAIAVVAGGLVMLSGRGHDTGAGVRAALVVALTIGAYSTIDAHGIRSTDTPLYVMASFIGTAASTTIFGLASGRRVVMVNAMRSSWRRFATMGVASLVTYGMVQLAFQRAAVGYVTALRESSVVIAAFVGSRVLGETAGRRRMIASGVVLAGLILLVIAE